MHIDKSKRESLEIYFQNSINHNISMPDKTQSFITQENKHVEEEDVAFVPHQYKDSKSSKFWRSRHQVDENCRFFFSFVKPRGTPNGTRLVFIYSPPLIALFDHIHEELEIIPSSTEFYFEGRFLILINNGEERVFSIKCEEKRLIELTKNNSTDEILQYFKMCQLNKYLIPPNFLTYPLYNKILFNIRFFELVSKLPKNIWNQDLLDNYVRASDPLLDKLFDKLFDNYFALLDVEPQDFEPDEFCFIIARQYLQLDEVFCQFKVTVAKAEKIQDQFVLGYETSPFTERSAMILHLLYMSATKHFPNSQYPSKVINSLVICEICSYLFEKREDTKLKQLRELMNSKQGNLQPQLYKRYLQVSESFKKQPTQFVPSKKGTYTYDSFIIILGVVWSHVNDFIEIIEPSSTNN